MDIDARTIIDELPNEILEYVFEMLQPYEDLENCMLVCKRWLKGVQRVVRRKKLNFYKAIGNFKVQWDAKKDSSQAMITKRYSHSACSYENSMYVFGGCTCSSTTFNDLWRLELSTRTWHRLLTLGSYPSPKACASLVYHKKSLILFGGWTHPAPTSLYQAWRTFNELHVYDVVDNRWRSITSPSISPPPVAGHAATVHGDNMIVFGGLREYSGGSNEVWCLNLTHYTWTKKDTTELKPHPRYRHSQIALDDEHLCIIGGFGGPPNTVLDDIWLLTMVGRVWTWTLIQVENPQWAATHLWCHPACKVDDVVVVLSRNPDSAPNMLAYSKWTANSHISNEIRRVSAEEFGPNGMNPNNQRPIDRDINVNGRRGYFNQRNERRVEIEERGPAAVAVEESRSMLYFRQAPTPPVNAKRLKQLEALKRMEVRVKRLAEELQPPPPPPQQIEIKLKPPKMAMFVLDIAGLLSDAPRAAWLPVKSVACGGPEATILYSLVKGKAELIMFGGIKKDSNSLVTAPQCSLDASACVSNTVHFITAAS